MIGRFIAGIAVGGNNAIIPLYVNEISPKEISGKMVNLFFMFILINLYF